MYALETWLKHSDKLYHPDYVCVRRDREIGVGGGVAILVKKSINFNIISMNTKIIENIGIIVTSSENKSFKLFSTYFPGGTNTSELQNNYKRDLRKLFNLNGSYIFVVISTVSIATGVVREQIVGEIY